MRHFDVVVQQQVVFRINLPQCLVIALGKAPVPLQSDDVALGESLGKQIQGAVRRSVVRNIYLCLFTRILHDGRQILLQHLLSVPVQYDYCQLIH